MKALKISALFGTLIAPFSAHAHPGHGVPAHPGHEGVLHELAHMFAGIDPVWGGVVAGMAMIVGALYIAHTRT